MEQFDSQGKRRATPPSQTLHPAARLAGVHIKKWSTAMDQIPHHHENKRLLFCASFINVRRDSAMMT